MSRALAVRRDHHAEIAYRADELLADLVASLRIVAGSETDAGEVHFALARAITNAIRIELMATSGWVDEHEVERRLAAALRSEFHQAG